jgi:hypothetical protein
MAPAKLVRPLSSSLPQPHSPSATRHSPAPRINHVSALSVTASSNSTR